MKPFPKILRFLRPETPLDRSRREVDTALKAALLAGEDLERDGVRPIKFPDHPRIPRARDVDKYLDGYRAGGGLVAATVGHYTPPTPEETRAAVDKFLAEFREVVSPVRIEFGARAWVRLLAMIEAEAPGTHVASEFRNAQIHGRPINFRGMPVCKVDGLNEHAAEVVYSDGSRRPLANGK